MYFFNAVFGVLCALVAMVFLFFILVLWNKKKFFMHTSSWFSSSEKTRSESTDQKKFSLLLLANAYFFVITLSVLLFREHKLETALTLGVVTFIFCSFVSTGRKSSL